MEGHPCGCVGGQGRGHGAWGMGWGLVKEVVSGGGCSEKQSPISSEQGVEREKAVGGLGDGDGNGKGGGIWIRKGRDHARDPLSCTCSTCFCHIAFHLFAICCLHSLDYLFT